MKPTTEKGFREKLRQACRGVGTYREEFEPLIGRLAAVYVRMQAARAAWVAMGSELLVMHTNKAGATNLVKHPLLVELDSLQQIALGMEKELGLTPASLKKINEAALGTGKKDDDPLAAALASLRVV